ncbi:MAG: hypothetical protein LUH05_02660 [Candidatus Gastranaerophilales bacterium]|nr:hypothetical protein [Candidatus Gastranaerophilales bacterium]
MQNFNTLSYINKSKVINIKSEILCREAEDDVFYFNGLNKAYKKLTLAVKLTPYHLKSLVLLADICYIKGFIKKAFILYKRAEEVSPYNAKVLAAIANCLYFLRESSSEALIYCDKAISCLNSENSGLLSQILEVKINVYMNRREYKKAYETLIQAKNLSDRTIMIYNINYEMLLNKINLHKKLQHSKLQIV